MADAERTSARPRASCAAREMGHSVGRRAVGARKTTRADRLARRSRSRRPARDGHLASTGVRIPCALCARRINDRPPRDSPDGAQAGSSTTRRTKAGYSTARNGIREAWSRKDRVVQASRRLDTQDVTTPADGGSERRPSRSSRDGARCEIDTRRGRFRPTRIVPAEKLAVVSCEEMIEMSASGAGVLHWRRSSNTRPTGVRIHCASVHEEPGTYVIGEEGRWNAADHRGDALDGRGASDDARVPDHRASPRSSRRGRANVNVDMITQHRAESTARSPNVGHDAAWRRTASAAALERCRRAASRASPRSDKGKGRSSAPE